MPVVAGGAALAADVGADVAAPVALDVGVDAFAAAAPEEVAAATIPDLSAEAGLASASSVFGDFSPDLFAANEADLATGGFGTDIVGADTAAGGLDTLNATFGTFNPDLFAADTADVATGGFGTDLAGADFTGTTGDLLSGAGGGPGAGVVGGPVGDTFGGVTSPDVLSDVGTAGGGTNVAAPASWGDVPTPEGFTNTGTQAFGEATSDQPLYSSEGLPDTPGSGASFANTMNVPSAVTPTTPGGAASSLGGSIQAGGVPTASQEFSDLIGPGGTITSGDIPATPASFSAPAGTDFSGTSMFNTGGVVPGTGIEAAPEDFTAGVTPGATQTTLTPGGFDTGIQTATVGPSPQMVAGAPDYTLPGAAAPATPGGAPIATSALAPAAATPATAATAASGVSPLTALRYGTAGVNAIAAGVNLSNALNQPSYPALQPAAYPGSIYSPYYSSMQPGVGGGGIAGGTAAARLTNGLVSGESPQQLAQSGIISPQRAATLQQTYNDIAQQYAQTLGVSPQSLSTGVQRMIAARALGDTDLGGR